MNNQQKSMIKFINKAYDDLRVLNNITWEKYRDDLLKMEIASEKRHRNSMPDWKEYHDNARVVDCGKLWVVLHIAECFTQPDKYTVKDYINVKKSCILACSIVENYWKEIKEAWKDYDINQLANLDYLMLVDYDLYLEHQEKRAA